MTPKIAYLMYGTGSWEGGDTRKSRVWEGSRTFSAYHMVYLDVDWIEFSSFSSFSSIIFSLCVSLGDAVPV